MRHRKSADRGATRLVWLDSRHAFSFGSYFDPAWQGFRGLRVLNEDRVAPGFGFGAHPHRDAEILTLVLRGGLEHRDSEGHRSVVRRGDVQRMSAGTGVVHSEWNASPDEPVHFVQVWLRPDRPGRAPRYDEAAASWHDAGRPVLIASRDGRDGSLPVHADADVWAASVAAGTRQRHVLGAGRGAWLQVLRGVVRVGELLLEAGDAAAIEGETGLTWEAAEDADLLLFDLA